MQYGVPIFEGRVSPRCSLSEEVLIIRVNQGNIIDKKFITIKFKGWINLLNFFIDKRIDSLVCGGINKEDKSEAKAKGIDVIDNVACDLNELYEAIESNRLRSNYGFYTPDIKEENKNIKSTNNIDVIPNDFNCLRCFNNVCEKGEKCPFLKDYEVPIGSENEVKLLDCALDVSMEDERILCRLTEVIYFALEMKYKRIGVAYCIDLREASEILVSVLRRFFYVNAVCCKVSGKKLTEESEISNLKIACNPIAQAEILNSLDTDLNIIVGLCIGSDAIFTKLSKAPVTTLFVKDKSLANNPIGAIYSEYYLKEVHRLNNIDNNFMY